MASSNVVATVEPVGHFAAREPGGTLVKQVEEVVQLVREVLGDDEVVGAYLHGSAVLGGLNPHSDLDVFVVSRSRTTTQQRWSLVEVLLEISGASLRGSAVRPIELTIVARPDVVPWRYPPRCEFQYGEWLRDELEKGKVPSPAPDSDLASLITIVLTGNAPLYGPNPEEVLEPVPHEDVVRAMTAAVPEQLAGLEEDTTNAILTLARIWTTLAYGEIRSKDAAADWALDHLPEEHRTPLAHARAVYLGEEKECWEDLRSHLRPHADYVVGAIEELTAPYGINDLRP